jgi:tripartite-type tricarboxylate transporter receptor subunit TctC
LFVPAKTPQSIIKSIEQVALEILNDPTLKKRLAEQGVIAMGLSSDEFSKFLTVELEKYQTIVKAANITTRP